MEDPDQEPKNTSKLRSVIDAGKARDKVAYPDPAAVPLGADDEAAGTPVTEAQARTALEYETRTRHASDKAATAVEDGRSGQRPAHRAQSGRKAMPRAALIIICLAVLVVVLLLV